MAIPRRGARQIIVDGVAYHWLIRRQATDSQYPNGCLHVAVQLAQHPGVVLVLFTDIPHPGDAEVYHSPDNLMMPVTPAEVAAWIRQAIQAGWTPSAKGPRFEMEVHHRVA